MIYYLLLFDACCAQKVPKLCSHFIHTFDAQAAKDISKHVIPAC